MRKSLAVAITTLALGAFALPTIAIAACAGHKTASTGTEVASAEQTKKPAPQTPVRTE